MVFNDKFKTQLLPAASVIYFLLNSVGLPAPLTYTTGLGLLKNRIILKEYGLVLAALLVVFAGYSVLHISQGVVLKDYLFSTGFYGLLIVSALAAFIFLKENQSYIRPAFQLVSVLSFGLFVVATIFLLTPYSSLFWTDHKFIGDGAELIRYKGMSYEPSHYALTLSPVFLFFLAEVVFRFTKKALLYLAAVAIPIVLTLSFGFVLAFGGSFVVVFVVGLFRGRWFRPRTLLILVVVVSIASVAMLNHSNPISDRVHHILSGEDTSVNGRTTEAFMLAQQCAATQSEWWGIGQGQIKYVSEEIIRPYYQNLDPVGYSKENWPILRIPNSLAETLAIYGFSGLILKLGLLLFFFVIFRGYTKYFTLAEVSFMFGYQFVGSYI